MTQTQLYERLKKEFARIVAENGLAEEPVAVRCRALTPEEAIGNTRRTDFPILEGKDVMIQAEYRGSRGQAFTDAPAAFSGTLAQVLALDILQDAHARGLFIACLNAVMAHLGRCTGTVHCRTQGPEQCAVDMHAWLDTEYPNARRVGLVGYQPALLEMLAGSGRQVRVLDLNPENVGATRFGVRVEDGARAREDLIQWADLILCTGSRGQVQAITVVVSMSSAMPWASLPMTLAEAGAISTRSARLATEICSTSKEKFRSKVSTRHLLPVSVSKVMGWINLAALAVMITCTSQCSFFRALAREAAL